VNLTDQFHVPNIVLKRFINTYSVLNNLGHHLLLKLTVLQLAVRKKEE
jgi:hypothetical protein